MPSFETPADIFTRLSVFDSLTGSLNTFQTHKSIRLYFKIRYLIIIYNYYLAEHIYQEPYSIFRLEKVLVWMAHNRKFQSQGS